MHVPRLGLISGLLRVDYSVNLGIGQANTLAARVSHRFRKRSVQLEAGLVEGGETDMSISHPRTGRGDTATWRLLI